MNARRSIKPLNSFCLFREKSSAEEATAQEKKPQNNPDKIKEFQTLYVFQLWFILSRVAAINCHQSTGRVHTTVISANKPADVVHRNDNVK